MATSILDPHVRRRRRAADAPRRRRDHLAQRPGRRVGRDGRQGPRAARRDRRARGRVSDRDAATGRRPPGTSGSTAGSLPADGPHLSAFDRGFQLGDGVFETLRARGGRPTELAEHLARLRRSAAGLDIALPGDVDEPARGRASRRCSRPTASTARTATRRSGSRCQPRRRSAAAASCRPTRSSSRRSSSRPGRSSPPPAGHLERGLHLVASRRPARPGEPAGGAQDDAPRRLRLRPARGAPRRRRRRAVPDHRRPPVGGDERQHLPGPAGSDDGRRAGHAVARLRDPARHDPVVAARLGGRASGSAPVEAPPDAGRPRRGRRGVPVSSVAGILPVTAVRGRADRRRTARAVDAPGARGSRGVDPPARRPA